MLLLVAILGILVGLVSLVCWIMTLIKMFSSGILTGVLGLICALYALIWAWQNRPETGPIAPIWTVCVLFSLVLNVLLRTVPR